MQTDLDKLETTHNFYGFGKFSVVSCFMNELLFYSVFVNKNQTVLNRYH